MKIIKAVKLHPTILDARKNISKRALQVLVKMYKADKEERYEDAEIIQEGRVAYLDLDRVSNQIVEQLLKAIYVSCTDFGARVVRYHINEDGKRAAQTFLKKGK